MTEPVCWLVRAGEQSRHARRFADHGVVAVGWGPVDDLRDLRGLDRSQIHSILVAFGGIGSPDQDTAELLAFRDDIHVGDIVVSPDGQTSELLVGEVAGEYSYRDPSPAADYRHVRDVQWYGRMARNELPKELADELRYRRTLRRLTHQEEWRQVAADALAGKGRDPLARGRRGAERGTRARHGPEGAPSRTCPGCGLTKALAQFTSGSELCVDCR